MEIASQIDLVSRWEAFNDALEAMQARLMRRGVLDAVADKIIVDRARREDARIDAFNRTGP